MKATQRIYRSADDEIVAEGDPRAAFLLVNEGHDVPKEYQAKVKAFLGDEPEEEPADVKEADEADNKKAAPARNKAK